MGINALWSQYMLVAWQRRLRSIAVEQSAQGCIIQATVPRHRLSGEFEGYLSSVGAPGAGVRTSVRRFHDFNSFLEARNPHPVRTVFFLKKKKPLITQEG